MTWKPGLEAGAESLKCRWDIVPYTRGTGIEVGGKTFEHFVSVDNYRDAKLFGAEIHADVRADASSLPQFASDSHDFVFSSHVLEHIEDCGAALNEWWRLIKLGGHLVLYLPHADFYPRMGTEGANPDHKHDFLPADIYQAMEFGSWDLIVNEERDGGDEYSMLMVFEKKTEGKRHSWRQSKPAKTCGIARYGAWGDGIQISSILPGLKAQGYHITLHATPRCWEVLKHEPLIDRVVLQDEEQVPNHLLGEYCDHLRAKYDKFVDLSESVEANFLAMSHRTPYHWPKDARHRLMNHNYGEMLHAIADVPYMGYPESRFVPSEEEDIEAESERWRLHGPVIMWVLSGSAVHKTWSHIDDVFASVLKEFPSATIITVGDEKCKKLEKPWENEPRIMRKSGVLSIRQTMALARHCDLVVGPETGVMNAVAMESMPKIVLLSHSSDENLTRDWLNTSALWSERTPCAPCHKMIHKWSQCNRHDSGTAHCMHAISADEVWGQVYSALKFQEEKAAA